ncbi:MAG: GreA/GreB family elongation factor [Sphingomonas bacterium]|nr:GreA/GreB family elongation factor [Sphingomonas bacterium]MDB5684716.1 GreA/GreB family elongation factor [Sphingomonas bacterium]MDB5718820.1 GreA/GreB family elongation factor [Sphingomonas bacterium]
MERIDDPFGRIGVGPGMSVAFRRESDEEHLEPRPELPVPPGPNLVTLRGMAQIEGRVAELEQAVAAGGEEAAVTALKRDLRYWHVRRATAQLASRAAEGEAGFGSRVGYRLNNGPLQHAEIVGADEAEPAAGRIAFTAPLARALIGGTEGERIDFGGKPGALEIVSIDPIADVT